MKDVPNPARLDGPILERVTKPSIIASQGQAVNVLYATGKLLTENRLPPDPLNVVVRSSKVRLQCHPEVVRGRDGIHCAPALYDGHFSVRLFGPIASEFDAQTFDCTARACSGKCALITPERFLWGGSALVTVLQV